MAQGAPQAPQFASSIFVFTQLPPQSSKPPAQLHCEAVQTSPEAHLFVQLPQWAGLFSVLTQSAGSPQAVLLDGQTHVAPTQT